MCSRMARAGWDTQTRVCEACAWVGLREFAPTHFELSPALAVGMHFDSATINEQ